MTDTSLRIDKYLWHTRLVKTRSLAARLCEAGHVERHGSGILKPATQVRVGDRITLSHGGWRRDIEIVQLGERRGSATEAITLYVEKAAPVRLSRGDPLWESLIEEATGPAA